MKHRVVKVAVVQMGTVGFQREATLAAVCEKVRESAGQGADLVVFPEAVLPGYPRGLDFGVVVGHRDPEGRRRWQTYWDEAVDLNGPHLLPVKDAACEAGVHVALGVVEREDRFRGGTLYCTLAIIDPQGGLLHRHRKLKPTAAERLIWGEGDGRSLQVIETPLGRLGGLICWENYMPLARSALYHQGIEIYLAPTADNRSTWQATIRHIACEGRCFVLSCNQFVTRDDYPSEWLPHLADGPHVLSRGGSAIVSPMAEVLAGPLWDEPGILYADLDLSALAQSRFDFDGVGHYARPDVLGLTVHGQRLTGEKPVPAGDNGGDIPDSGEQESQKDRCLR